jgi:SAM-dependent methyltransferase
MDPRSVIGRSKWLIVANQLRHSWLGRRRERSGRSTTSGAQSRRQSVPEAVGYVHRTFELLLTGGGITEGEIRGKRILELGPGDHLGLGLRFLAAGAERVLSVDRFAVAHEVAPQRRIYEALLASLGPEQRARLAEVITLDRPHPNLDEARIQLIPRLPIEDALGVLEPGSFDLIFSVAVGEHLRDSDDAFRAMHELLASGGTMLHQIDLRDHGMFSRFGMNPLTFLTIPEWLYRAMVRGTGAPNRRMIAYYRTKISELGLTGSIVIKQVVGEAEPLPTPRKSLVEGRDYGSDELQLIREVRPKLAGPFRDLGDEELLASAIFLTARR